MAIWHLDNITGSPANNGLSAGTPKKDLADIASSVQSNDIIKLKYTGTNYGLGLPTGSASVFFTNAPSTLLITCEDGDTQRPKVYAEKDPSNPTFFWSLCGATTNTRVTFLKCDVLTNYANLNNTVSPLNLTSGGTNTVRRFVQSNWYMERGGSSFPSIALQWQNTLSSNISSEFFESFIIGDGSLFNIGQLGSFKGSNWFKSGILNITASASNWLTGCTAYKSYFHFKPNISNFYLINPGAGSFSCVQKTVFFMEDNPSISTSSVYLVTGAAIGGLLVDNIYITNSAQNYSIYRGNGATTFIDGPFVPMGNSLYRGGNIFDANVTGGREDYGTTQLMSASPFLSETFGSPDFLKVDFTSSVAISQIIGKSVFDTYENIGAEGSSSGGETDPNKVLSTSLVVSGTILPSQVLNTHPNGTMDKAKVMASVTGGTLPLADVRTTKGGTLVVPVAGDVRAGVSVDATTGVLNLPAQADVKEGVTYDNATKTGTLHLYVTDNILASDLKIGVTKTVKDVSITGTYDGSDRFDVPAESDVREGVDFVDNTVPKTGTLHLEQTDTITADELKIGVTKTVKDVSLTGTYDGSDRFDVPDEADVREGVEYIDNLENKTGTLLLPQTDDIMASDMRVGVTKIVKDVSITGTYDGSDRFQVPSEDEVLDGVEFVDNTVEKTGNVVLPLEADVREGVEFGPNNSLTGEAGVDKPSIDPGEGNVLKGVEYEIDGVPKVGQYDTGEGDITPGENNIRIKVLKMIENKLYGIDPAKSAKYQNVVRSVSYEPLVKNGLTQDDYPHVQIAAEENQYDHAFVLSGNMPLVTMRVRFIITTPGNWTALDAESLYEDIRQCFIRDNFTLEGLVILTKVEGFMPLATDADKEDQNRKGQLTMMFKFIETIE